MAYSVPALAKFSVLMNRTGLPNLTVVSCCCVMLALAACGQTGPLYLPDEAVPSIQAEEPPVSEEAVEQTLEEDEDTR
jgi:predicted small lipoprotein YifL